jgi:hypothetical protein
MRRGQQFVQGNARFAVYIVDKALKAYWKMFKPT